MKKKIFALFLCLAMVMSLLPTSAFAADVEDVVEDEIAAEAEVVAEETTETWSITGIVIANERFCIDTDENGDSLNFVETYIDASGNQQTRYVFLSYVTDAGESLIYYEGKNASGDRFIDAITINRSLDDDMLGTKVTVNFTADVINNNGRIDYKNIEVLGDVILHEDTVVYTVPAMDTDIYPNGESTSSTAIRPYIGFMADGTEHKIEMSKDVAKYPKNIDAQMNATAAADISYELNQFAYVLDDYSIGADDAWLYRHQDEYDYNYGTAYDSASDMEFISDMGIPCLAQYRFVSVDGGETYSYMFKMVDDFDASGARGNIAYGFVSAYNRAAGTICFTGINGLTGTYDIGSEVVVNGKITVDAAVIVYRENGKIVVEPVEVFDAAVEDFTTDGGVTLNGKTYYAWADCEETRNFNSIFEYYNENDVALGASTTYYTYNNLILEIEADDSADTANSDYAVVLRSYYDADLDTAHVKLGFADGTEGTYKVGKLYTPKASDLTAADNNLPMELANNSAFGLVVKYAILADGTVDLSGQDFEEIFAGCVDSKTKLIGGYWGAANVTGIVRDGKFQGKYGYSDDTVIFALYGNPGMVVNGTSVEINAANATYYVPSYNGKYIWDSSIGSDYYGSYGGYRPAYSGEVGTHDMVAYAPVKAKAYKLSELKNLDANAIQNLFIGDYTSGGVYVSGNDRGTAAVGSYILNTTKNANNYIVAAAVTVGYDLAQANASYDSDANTAYVVSANQLYNSKTGLYYAEVTLIDENGKISAKTVDDVQNDASQSMLDPDDGVGKLDGRRLDANGNWVANWSGRFVRYAINNDGIITMLDTGDDWGNYTVDGDGVDYSSGKAIQGLYLVNLTGVRGDIVSFYDYYVEEGMGYTLKDLPTVSLEYAEDGCDIIGIDEDDYAGEVLSFISSREEYLPMARGGNAVIYVNEDGEIEKIFSFTPNYVADGDLAAFDEIEEVTLGNMTCNFTYGAVTYYDEAKDVIKIEGADPVSGVYKPSELVIKGDMTMDSPVVCYKDGEDCVVEVLGTVSGAIEEFTDDGGAVIGGKTYYGWPYAEEMAGYTSFYEYCSEEKLDANTVFYVYDSWILKIDADAVASAESYAVILRSYYDEAADEAYVKLGFADNTEGVYKVGKLYTPKASNLTAAENNLPQELANNSLFGVVVNYKIRDDGSVDLSGQDFEDIFSGSSDVKTKLISSGGAGIVRDGRFHGKYGYSDDTVIFALYGNPGMVVTGSMDVTIDAANAAYYVQDWNGKYISDGAGGYRLADTTIGEWGTHSRVEYAPVKAKAYTLADIKNLDANAIPNLLIGDYMSGGAYVAGADRGSGVNGSYILNTTKSANSYIAAAAVTVGYDLAQANICYDLNGKIGYVVSAEQCLNMTTGQYYAKFVIISNDGKISAKTVDDVQNDASQSMLDPDDGVGKLDGKRLDANGNWVANWSGRFVRYAINNDGIITMLDTGDDWGSYAVRNGNSVTGTWVSGADHAVQYTSGKAIQGLYLVNLAGVRGDIVSFYDYYLEANNGFGSGATLNAVLKDFPTVSLEYAEDGCDIIGIDEDDYAGEVLSFISSREEYLPMARGGNAVIYVNEDGEIATIFSFTKGADSYATISYDLNGGEGDIPGFTKRTGTDVPLPETVPVREGYIFMGWAESADATEAVYQPGGLYDGDADATLYAVWKLARLTGDANGDGEIDFVDAMLALKHDAGIEELTGDNLLAADANSDGSVDFVDAILILKYDAGLIEEF